VKTFRVVPLLIAIAGLGALIPVVRAQSVADTSFSSSNAVAPSPSNVQPQLELAYKPPTERAKLRSYLFDTFGPYPIAGAAIMGGFDQADKTPPEWGQGAGAYGERVGSNFGIEMVTTTTRYALAEAFHEDTLYYRCECQGVFHRLGHAVISTVTARHGNDGHRRFSFPALVAPYTGSMTVVYGWYPSPYGAKDGLRMGNYALLAFAGGNIAREFIYGGPHTLFGRTGRSPSGGTNSVASSNP
jgi:nitrate reductase NapE component